MVRYIRRRHKKEMEYCPFCGKQTIRRCNVNPNCFTCESCREIWEID